MTRLIYLLAILCTCLLVWSSAHAETIRAGVTTAVDPGLVQQYIKKSVPPLDTNLTPAAKLIEPTAPPETAESKIKFKLTKIILKGNTVFSTDELETIFKPSINTMISIADLQALVNKVTEKYRAAGYILSRAILPPQTITNGVVQVQVIEGYISKVAISGNPGWVEKVLQKYNEKILTSRPLRIRVLEKSLLLMNDVPGVSAKAVLTPSKSISGSADLNVVTEFKRAAGYLSYDNLGSRYLGPQEIGAGVAVNSITWPGSSDGLRMLTVPYTNQMRYFEYNHTNPIGSEGTKFTFDTNYTRTKPGFLLDDFDVIGTSSITYFDLATPWIRSRNENLYIHSTFNYMNISSTILGQPFYSDLIRSLVFGGEYTSLDRFRGANDVRIDFEKGLEILGAVKHVNQSRPMGEPNFFKGTLFLSRLQALPAQFSLFAAALGQYAFNPLLATEQYAYGGFPWGRGYPPSEIVGDDGLGMKVELRRDFAIDKPWLSSIQGYLFYDAGIIWNRDGIDLPPKQSATSTGFGVQLGFMSHLTGNLYYAKPLTHSIIAQVAMQKDPLKPGIFFQLVASV
jgi:hemolysin activation/secretion protein